MLTQKSFILPVREYLRPVDKTSINPSKIFVILNITGTDPHRFCPCLTQHMLYKVLAKRKVLCYKA